jgi:hypothetical protein
MAGSLTQEIDRPRRRSMRLALALVAGAAFTGLAPVAGGQGPRTPQTSSGRVPDISKARGHALRVTRPLRH